MTIPTVNTFSITNLAMPGFISVGTFGAKGDGVTDDRAAIQLALQTAANLGGCIVYFPPGIYICGRSGASSFCLDMPGANITLKAVKGTVWLTQPIGLPALSIALMHCDNKSNLEFDGIGFDGNWGNAVTQISPASQNVALPTGTISVLSTAGFPGAGTFTVVLPSGPQVITYLGTTATSFTGCSGGTGTLAQGNFVGYVDANTGINQTTQVDPQNFLLMLRGCDSPIVSDCLFRQCYGDFIWMGASGSDANKICTNVTLQNLSGNLSARHGWDVAGPVAGLTVLNCTTSNIFGGAFHVEPQLQPTTNVMLDKCYLDGWFDPITTQPIPLSIAGSTASLGSLATNYRIYNCTVNGACLIQRATDVVLAKNRILQDFPGSGKAAIYMSFTTQDVTIDDNYVYTRLTPTGIAGGGTAAIVLEYNAIGSEDFQPTNIQITRNRIHARNGMDGIDIIGPGGNQLIESNTASAITDLTLVRAGAGWTVNQWVGFYVQVGTVTAAIASNTVDTLTLIAAHTGITNAWTTPLGGNAITPAAGTYTIYASTGEVVVDDNQIDCSNDGYGNGGYGIRTATDVVGAPVTGARVRLRGNQIKNANTDGIHITAGTVASPYLALELADNKAYDTQLVPTCLNTITFEATPNINKLILRNNQANDGVATAINGLTTGTWLVDDGSPQIWAGWGSPNGVVTANIGSLYMRRDAGGAAAVWTKEADEGLNTGWVRLTQPAPVGWTVDSGSGIGIPQNSTEWTNVIAAAGLTGIVSVPDSLWLCQEAAGNLADSIGAFPLTAAGAGLTYQTLVEGWQSKAIATSDNQNGGWSSTDAGLPDISIANATMCGYIIINTNSNVNRQVIALGVGNVTRAWIGGAQATRAVSGANSATATGSQYQTVRPYGIQCNRIGVTVTGFEDHDKLIPAFAAGMTGKKIALGYAGETAPPGAQYLYAWSWLTTTPTPTQIKALYQVLGWVVDW